VTASVTSVAGGNFEAIDFSGASATANVVDTIDTTYVQISVDESSVIEGATLTYTVSLVDEDGNSVPVPDNESITVSVDWSGAAASGVDTSNLPSTLTLRGESSETFSVDVLEDSLGEPVETLIATVSGVTDESHIFEAIEVDQANSQVQTVISGNTGPEIGNQNVSVYVSEEGLTEGLVDSTGQNVGDDTTNDVVVSGSLAFSDADGDSLTVSIQAPNADYHSNGEAVNWIGVGTNTLIGSANGESVITVTVDSTGNYAVTLQGPVDHPDTEGEDAIDLTFGVTVSDGVTSQSTNMVVQVEDDAPEASDQNIAMNVDAIVTNLAVIVDISSSMSDSDLQLTKDGINKLIEEYSDIGTVNVNVVQFYGNGNINSDWVSSADGLNITLDNSQRGTDIEQGLREMVEGSYSGNQPGGANYTGSLPDADQNMMYFFGDGNTYGAYEDDFDAYLPTWNDFVTSGEIDKLYTYSVNTSSVLSDIEDLADNGENIISQDPVNIRSVDQLEETVTESIEAVAVGSLLDEDGNGHPYLSFGADDGHIQSVTIGSTTVTYDANSPIQVVAGEYGEFELNFETGDYRYVLDEGLVDTNIEEVAVTVVDKDGDYANSTLNFEVEGNPVATVNLEATSEITEAGDTVTYTASVDTAAATDMTVVLSNGERITIEAGNTRGSVDVSVAADEDAVVDPSQLSVTIESTSGGGYADVQIDGSAAVTHIVDTIDTTTVTLSGNTSVSEGETATYTVSVDNAPAEDMTVDVTYRYQSADSDDMVEGVSQVTIPAGSTSVSFNIDTLEDAYVEGDEVYSVAISNPSTGGLEAVELGNASVETTIVNDDQAPESAAIPDQSNEDAEAISIDMSNYFTDTDALTYSATGLPSGLSMDPGTGVITGTMDNSASQAGSAGVYSITVTASDGVNPTASETFDWTVTNPGPVAVDDSAEVREAGSISVSVANGVLQSNDRDVDNDTLTMTDIRTGAESESGSGTLGSFGVPLVGSYGSLTLNDDGSYRYQADETATDFLSEGQQVNDVFTYTISDGEGGTDTAELVISITGTNDAPVVGSDSVRVSEEGLDNALADTTGTSDTTDSATVTGTIPIVDTDTADTHAVTLTAPSGTVTSNGEMVTWSGSGTTDSPLIGSAGGSDVIKATIDSSGSYTVSLLGPVDHDYGDNVEGELSIDFGVRVDDGSSVVTSDLTVTIEDDSPVLGVINQDVSVSQLDSNLLFIVDTSGSMGWDADTGGYTITTIERMELLLTSMKDVIEKYEALGDVKVQIVTFDSGSDTSYQSEWLTTDEAYDFIGDGTRGSRDPLLDPGGGTDYDRAVDVAETGYAVAGKIDGSSGDPYQNVSYFLSDGQPQTRGGIENSYGITGDEITEWTTWLESNEVDSYAVGFGSGLDQNDRVLLDPLAYDGVNSENREGLIVADSTTLGEQLLSTVASPASGNIFGVENSDGFGADDGHFESISLDGVTYTYDPEANSGAGRITVSNGEVISGAEITVDTDLGGNLVLNFDTGDYQYTPNSTLSMGQTAIEIFTFSAIDNDGDAATGTVNLNISKEIRSNPTALNEVTLIDTGHGVTEIDGNLMDNIEFGADGAGDIESIAYDGITYRASDYTGSGDEVTILTIDGGSLVFNFVTGDYTFSAGGVVNEVFTVKANDADGDSTRFDLKVSSGQNSGQTVLEEYSNGVTGWSDASTESDQMRINSNTTNGKLFEFGSSYADQTVTLEFDLEVNSLWERSHQSYADYFEVWVDGQKVEGDALALADQNNGTVSVTVDLDSQGRLDLEFKTINTESAEYALVDNLKIEVPGTASTMTTVEEYSGDTHDWSNASIENNALFIDNGQTASKTYQVDPHETVLFSFDVDTQGTWEPNDNFVIYINGLPVMPAAYDDFLGSVQFEARADADGDIEMAIELNTNGSGEEVRIDNLNMTRTTDELILFGDDIESEQFVVHSGEDVTLVNYDELNDVLDLSEIIADSDSAVDSAGLAEYLDFSQGDFDGDGESDDTQIIIDHDGESDGGSDTTVVTLQDQVLDDTDIDDMKIDYTND